MQTLVLSLLSLGFNDYSGRLFGMSPDIAYKALQKLDSDLAFVLTPDSFDASNAVVEHWPFLMQSECAFSLAVDSFDEFIKLLYIEKNASLFKDVLKLPLPKNVQSWKKADLL